MSNDPEQSGEKDRLNRTSTWVTLIGGIIAILGFFGFASFSELVGGGGNGGTSRSVTPVPPGSTPSRSVVQPPPGEPSLLIAPNPIQPSQRVQIAGEGFQPGANVTIRSAGGATIGFDQADQRGSVRIVFGPLDQSICSIGQDQWTAYVSNQPVADVVVNSC